MKTYVRIWEHEAELGVEYTDKHASRGDGSIGLGTIKAPVRRIMRFANPKGWQKICQFFREAKENMPQYPQQREGTFREKLQGLMDDLEIYMDAIPELSYWYIPIGGTFPSVSVWEAIGEPVDPHPNSRLEKKPTETRVVCPHCGSNILVREENRGKCSACMGELSGGR